MSYRSTLDDEASRFIFLSLDAGWLPSSYCSQELKRTNAAAQAAAETATRELERRDSTIKVFRPSSSLFLTMYYIRSTFIRGNALDLRK
jgi:hypothetical protein